MRRLLFTIVTSTIFQFLLFTVPTVNTILATNLNITTDSIMDADIFQVDETMLCNEYPEASIKPTGIPPATNNEFSHNLRLHFSPNNTNLPNYLIITPNILYDSLNKEMRTYAEDVHTIYGYGIYLETVDNATPEQLKSLILGYYDNLYGVLLIGNLPECLFEIEKDYGDRYSYGYRKWPCDLFYMDLNGSWADTDINGIYDTHNGDVAPDIIFGRLSAVGLSSLGNEIALIRKQLQKSHLFWWKSSFHSADVALNYVYKDWLHRFNASYLSSVFPVGTVDDIRDVIGSPFSKSDYLYRLSLPQYGFVHLAAHSSPSHHNFYESGGSINLPEISAAVHNNMCLSYNLFCCSACNWLAASSQGYLGGIYLFNNGRTLSVVGSTKIGGMLESDQFYTYLLQKNIGESFRDWFRTKLGNSNTNDPISWYYGMTILGDPMINLKHQIDDICVANLTLTSCPSENHSNLVMFKAGNQINVTGNFTIPQGTHVIFDAPKVTFGKGFVCPVGASFESRSEGCEL